MVLQLFIAQMRYTLHTLGFEECTDWQKKLALYASCRLSELIRTGIEKNLKLRVDWIPLPGGRDGKLGLTILPGRKDRERDLDTDIEALKAQEVAAIYCLVEKAELEYYGLGDLVKRYESAGFQSYHYPIVDQRVPSDRAIREMVENISAKVLPTTKITSAASTNRKTLGSAIVGVHPSAWRSRTNRSRHRLDASFCPYSDFRSLR